MAGVLGSLWCSWDGCLSKGTWTNNSRKERPTSVQKQCEQIFDEINVSLTEKSLTLIHTKPRQGRFLTQRSPPGLCSWRCSLGTAKRKLKGLDALTSPHGTTGCPRCKKHKASRCSLPLNGYEISIYIKGMKGFKYGPQKKLFPKFSTHQLLVTSEAISLFTTHRDKLGLRSCWEPQSPGFCGP